MGGSAVMFRWYHSQLSSPGSWPPALGSAVLGRPVTGCVKGSGPIAWRISEKSH